MQAARQPRLDGLKPLVDRVDVVTAHHAHRIAIELRRRAPVQPVLEQNEGRGQFGEWAGGLQTLAQRITSSTE